MVSLEGFVSVCVFAIHKQIVSHSDAQNKTKIRQQLVRKEVNENNAVH